MKLKRTPPPTEAAMTPEEFQRVRLKVLKMTQAELAHRLGIKNVATISRWETGATPIAEDRAVAIELLVQSVRSERAARV
jgi:DNA-binding transcriptional regulator YiaG